MIEEWVLNFAGSGWVILALYLMAVIDGFFPPIPSESVVIALATLYISTGSPPLWAVTPVAAAGAFTGDLIAFHIGRRVDPYRLPGLRSERGTAALDWAARMLGERGAVFIIAARYIPIGRVAVNMSAGALGFPRRRFAGYAAIAACTWAVYSTLLGIGAGAWLGENPLLAVAVGIVLGVVMGVLIDFVMNKIFRRGTPVKLVQRGRGADAVD